MLVSAVPADQYGNSEIEFSADAIMVSSDRFYGIIDELSHLGIAPSRVEILSIAPGEHDMTIDDKEAAVIASLVNLKVVSMQDCDGINSIEPLRGLRKLQSLDIMFCRNVKDLEPIKDLPIKDLKTSYMDHMSDIKFLRCPIERLTLSCVDEIHFITRFKDTLRCVDIICGSKVTNSVPLALLHKLEVLVLEMEEVHVPRCVVDILSHIEPLREINVCAENHENTYKRGSSRDAWIVTPYLQ
jgi:hypothetical protein